MPNPTCPCDGELPHDLTEELLARCRREVDRAVDNARRAAARTEPLFVAPSGEAGRLVGAGCSSVDVVPAPGALDLFIRRSERGPDCGAGAQL
jgi:hypothetical protein